MKKYLSVICYSLFLSFFSLRAHSVQDQKYQAYREYFPLVKKVERAPQIVVFFSFASRESYKLIHPYEKGLIQKLQYSRYNIELVPVDFYSPYDNFLADAWCIAAYLNGNFTGRVNTSREQYFNNVFFFMSKYQSSGRDDDKSQRIQSIARIPGLSRGTDYYTYIDIFENLTGRCNNRRKEMIKSFNVTSVPSVYVNGEYLINDGVMSTREDSEWDYTELIDYLMYDKVN